MSAFPLSLAKRAAATPGAATPVVVRAAYHIALSRPPTESELSEATSFIDAQSATYTASGKADAHALALADFCHALMCLNEFVYID